MLTQRTEVTRSQMAELAMLARTWTAPAMIQSMYAVEKIVVQTASKRIMCSLRRKRG